MRTTAGMQKVLIVEDHPVTREGIAAVLRQEPDLAIIAEAEDTTTALKAIERERPDIAIVDIALRDSNGLVLVRELQALTPPIPAVVLSMHNEAFYAERALRAGAMGYITKSEDGDVIVHAIREVLAGRVYVSQALAGRMLTDLVGGGHGSPISRLTDREFEVFELLGRGQQPRQIAEKLSISVGTVDAHREHIKKKLNIASAQKLLVYAVQWIQGGEAR